MVRFDTLGTIDLRGPDGAPCDAILAQHKGLALLAYLQLASPRGFHRRDTVAALFWPEMDARRARAALSRTVYQIRRELGPDTIVSRGEEELAVGVEEIDCDALRFERALAARDWSAALDLYRGDLLPGFYLADGSPEFDRWLDGRRAELRSAAGEAAWQLGLARDAAGDHAGALRHARRHLALLPGDESALRNVLALLERSGNAGAAAQIYHDFVRRLATDFDLEPSQETQHAFARLARASASRREAASGDAASSNAAASSGDATSSGDAASALPSGVDSLGAIEAGATHTAAAPARTRIAATRRRARTAVLAVLGVAVLTLMAWTVTSSRQPDVPTLVVGDIASGLPGDSVLGFATLLTTNLGRIERLDVVSERRIAQLRAGFTELNAEAAARRAGADELIEGTLAARDGHGVRLDIRRTNVQTGEIVASYTIEGRDFYDLVDLAVERIARDLGLRAPAERPHATTGSLIAYHLYEEGLRAYYRGDRDAARRLFRSALDEDSAFAMAALFHGFAIAGHGMDEYLSLALRLADRSNERERLFISARWALHYRDPRAIAWAESLVVRYPDDLDGRLLYASVLRFRSRREATIPHTLHVIALDSQSIGDGPQCQACEAISQLAETYALMDSFPQAERVARIWLRHEPGSATAWHRLASVYERAGRFEEQAAAMDSALAREPGLEGGLAHESRQYRIGQFDSIDAVAHAAAASTNPGRRADGLWSLVVSGRTQGRLREALAAAREFRALRPRQTGDPGLFVREGFVEGVVLLDMGEFERAAALFDSVALAYEGPAPSYTLAHRLTWWTYVATALAAAGDTSRLAELEERIREAGRGSLSASHNRRHHYVRGLRLAARGQHDAATESFALALAPFEDDHALLHLGYARSAIAAGRYPEAIEQLRTVLEGPVGGAGWSVPRTSFEELLARAFDASGQVDSAMIYYGRVLHAWRRADPEFDGRRREIEARLAVLRGPDPARPQRPAQP